MFVLPFNFALSVVFSTSFHPVFLVLLFSVYASLLLGFGRNLQQPHFGLWMYMQQQETIMFHNEGKFLNLKPLIYLFLVLGA